MRHRLGLGELMGNFFLNRDLLFCPLFSSETKQGLGFLLLKFQHYLV